MQANLPSATQRAVRVSNLATVAVFPILGIGFAIGTVALWYSRPLVTGSPGDATYPIVLGVLVMTIVLCFIALSRFPTGFRLTTDELEVRYIHRSEIVATAAIRDIQVRGGMVNRSVWLVLWDGSERSLGTRNGQLVAAWRAHSDVGHSGSREGMT